MKKLNGTGVIYRIYNKVNGKSYIGQTVNLSDRIYRHFSDNSGSLLLKLAIEKYGKESFRVEVLHDEVPLNLLDKMEIIEIRFWGSISPNGYNITEGGYGLRGYQFTDEDRVKMSVFGKGKKRSPETCRRISNSKKGDKHPFYGKALSDSHKTKISKAMTGIVRSEETKRSLSEMRMGYGNPAYGTKHSDEHKAKISESLRKAWVFRKLKGKDAIQLEIPFP